MRSDDFAADDIVVLLQFFKESEDSLKDIEPLLETLTSNPEDEDSLHAVFRAIHGIKGNASFLDMQSLSTLSHSIESAMCDARDGKTERSAENIGSIISDILELKKRISDLAKTVRKNDEKATLELSQDETRQATANELFHKAPRLLDSLASSLGKKFKFSLNGGETILSKAFIQTLDPSIVHILRNIADHGAEKPEERIRLSKPAECVINASVRKETGQLIIEIEDDGRGLDYKNIYATAVNKKIITSQNELTRKEIENLIFLPGLSTADSVTLVSGRGVGMDAVKDAVNSLDGKIEVKSELGKGAKFIISLPNP